MAAATVEERLAALEDRQAVSDLMLAFGAALDAKDWAAYTELFLVDGKFTIEGQARHGRQEIVAGPRRDLDRYDALQHYSTNHKVAVEGRRRRGDREPLPDRGPRRRCRRDGAARRRRRPL
jgi:hypothetical protein